MLETRLLQLDGVDSKTYVVNEYTPLPPFITSDLGIVPAGICDTDTQYLSVLLPTVHASGLFTLLCLDNIRELEMEMLGCFRPLFSTDL